MDTTYPKERKKKINPKTIIKDMQVNKVCHQLTNLTKHTWIHHLSNPPLPNPLMHHCFPKVLSSRKSPGIGFQTHMTIRNSLRCPICWLIIVSEARGPAQKVGSFAIHTQSLILIPPAFLSSSFIVSTQ